MLVLIYLTHCILLPALQTVDITAVGGTDYQVQNTMVSVTLAGSPVTFNIAILDDYERECPTLDKFEVRISGMGVGTVNSVIVTIQDDDPCK